MNLENVAKYCEENYHKAPREEKGKALQETKNFTTHSLASVAYQINNLATNFLKLLDLQQAQLTDMESSVNHLNQNVMIHKEKVARREIGVLTAGRSVPRPIGMKNGIIYPEQTERPIRYTRKPIDYNILDDIGHGVKPQGSTPRAVRSPSVSSNHSNNSANQNTNQPPTTKPPTPPVYRAGSMGGGSQGGTIGRASGGQYRATGPPPVAPPMAPGLAAASLPPQAPAGNFPQPHPHFSNHSSSRSSASSGGGGGSYSPSGSVVMGTVHSPPSTALMGMGHPQSLPGQSSASGSYNPSPSTLHNMMHSANPSLMHPEAKVVYARNSANRGQSWIDTSTLPPPVDDDFPEPFMGSSASPPLPPPPDTEQFDFPPLDLSAMGPPSMRQGRMVGSEPEDTYAATQGLLDQGDQYAATGPQLMSQNSWVPPNYIEKVVAIYDYKANKTDELSFSENAMIYVIHKNDDGWWEGVMDGQTGLFPYNYVEPCR
ncbi:Abl interactor 1 [Elysia marginata]|uniref:Abl interactor 1 n=1 Tax=Elysia marginata TaxID=1093978 RepID=A0AAV4F2W7_9GAST|nr:Abl interactor 1 [Elysia marginata]